MQIQLYTYLLLLLPCYAYLQFPLSRLPSPLSSSLTVPAQCQDPKTVSPEQTKYLQVCLQKDIAYTVQLEHHPSAVYKMALDLTTPVSWLKGQTCIISGVKGGKCQLLESGIKQRVKNALKNKVTQIIKKLKLKIADEQSDKAIIEGSNQVVMGEEQKMTGLTVTGKNTHHTSNALQAILLGLYIIGQKDTIDLTETTFLKAHQISPNLNALCDGAISLRFDENAQKSFLKQLFKQAKSQHEIISVYLGEHLKVMTVGEYETKYMRNGISSLKRVKMVQDEHNGRAVQLKAVIFEGKDIEDGNIDDNSSAVFSLSTSFIAISNSTLTAFINKYIPHAQCKTTTYLECIFNNKQALQTFLTSTLNFDFDTSIVGFSLKDDLLLHTEGKKAKFNIKRSLSNYTVLGEPFFKKYYTYFDYSTNQVGYALRTLSVEQSFIQIVTLMHALMLLFLFLLCLVLSSQQFRQMYYLLFQRVMRRAEPSLNRIRQAYKPVGGQEESHRQDRVNELGEDIEGI